MAKHDQHFDPKDSHPIFEASNNFRRHHITGQSSDKEVADRLIKNEFHRYAGVGTGKDCCKGFLFIGGVLSQDGQIVLD